MKYVCIIFLLLYFYALVYVSYIIGKCLYEEHKAESEDKG